MLTCLTPLSFHKYKTLDAIVKTAKIDSVKRDALLTAIIWYENQHQSISWETYIDMKKKWKRKRKRKDDKLKKNPLLIIINVFYSTFNLLYG